MKLQVVTIERMSARDRLLLTAVLALILSVTAWSLQGPRPVTDNAPPDQFSASRAMAVLRDLLQEGKPHPVGTPLNRLVRERIEGRFAALGYVTDVQRDFVCNATPICATVENILARRPDDSGPYVLLVSHYDSVGAGPGASDAAGPVAAILEVARALKGPPGLAFLITDGEEAGLLGAEAFVKTEVSQRVSVVVNAENRGTSGPAFLFETSRGNAALMRAVRSIDRPYASSLFYTIYDLLPNDTDVSVFKRAGLQALNFGAIGNVAYYHTPYDSLANVDLRTLQHHGDNLLSVTRELLRGVPRSSTNAVFFDVLGLTVAWWPERWTVWIAIISLAVVAAMARKGPWRAIVTGVALSLAALVVAAALAALLTWLAHARADEAQRLAFPLPAIASVWLAGIAGALFAFALSRQKDRRALYAGAALLWHAGTIALSSTLPGTAYLLLIPSIGFAVGMMVRAPLFAALAASVPAAVLLFPLGMFLYPALAKTSLVPLGVLLGLMTTTFAPLFPGRRFAVPVLILAIAALAAGVTPALPVYTPESPRRAPIEHELAESTVEATATRDGDLVTIRVQSRRAADRLMLEIENRGEVLRVNGTAPAPPNRGRAGRRGITVYGREAVVELRAPAGATLTASDLTYGLPPEAASKEAARGASAVTSHRGDVTVSSTRLKL